jgi:hypothetical protein
MANPRCFELFSERLEGYISYGDSSVGRCRAFFACIDEQRFGADGADEDMRSTESPEAGYSQKVPMPCPMSGVRARFGKEPLAERSWNGLSIPFQKETLREINGRPIRTPQHISMSFPCTDDHGHLENALVLQSS